MTPTRTANYLVTPILSFWSNYGKYTACVGVILGSLLIQMEPRVRSGYSRVGKRMLFGRTRVRVRTTRLRASL